MKKIDIKNTYEASVEISGNFQEGLISIDEFKNEIENLKKEINGSKSRKKEYLINIVDNAYRLGLKYAPKNEEEAKARRIETKVDRLETITRY